jgi:ribosomal protein S18 acetylase RimI-like enzyme
MPLKFRVATTGDHARLEEMIIESFEPVTWAKKLDERFGPLNGRDWRARWQSRLRGIFAAQIMLVGEAEGEIAAMSSATLDRESGLAYIDLLAVDRRLQGRGYGRAMLRGMMAHLAGLGAGSVNLDCLVENDAGNALYADEGFVEVARHIRWFRKLG